MIWCGAGLEKVDLAVCHLPDYQEVTTPIGRSHSGVEEEARQIVRCTS